MLPDLQKLFSRKHNRFVIINLTPCVEWYNTVRDEEYNVFSVQIPLRTASASTNGKEMTQRELALKLEKPHSFVSKYETRARRLDPVEFLEVTEAL